LIPWDEGVYHFGRIIVNSTDYTTCGNGVYDDGEDCDDIMDDGTHGCVLGCTSGALPNFECVGLTASSASNCTYVITISYHQTSPVSVTINAFTIYSSPSYNYVNLPTWLSDAGGTDYL